MGISEQRLREIIREELARSQSRERHVVDLTDDGTASAQRWRQIAEQAVAAYDRAAKRTPPRTPPRPPKRDDDDGLSGARVPA